MTYQFSPEDAAALRGTAIASPAPSALPAKAPHVFAKTLFDRTFALVALVCLSPILLLVALCVLLSSGGPVIFGHERIGKSGRRFRCYKFRTMVPNAEELLAAVLKEDPEMRREWETHRKLTNDPRINRVGRFLRKTSLDELPQFWNVLMGDMSIVGPRPIVRDELKKYGSASAHYLSVRPGITGIWQTSGRSDISYNERVAIDVEYVETMSLWTDIKIVLKTVRVVLAQAGAH